MAESAGEFNFAHLRHFSRIWWIFQQSFNLNIRKIVLGEVDINTLDQNNPNINKVIQAINYIEKAQIEVAGIVTNITNTANSIPNSQEEVCKSILATVKRKHLCFVFILLNTLSNQSFHEFLTLLKEFLYYPDPNIRRHIIKSYYIVLNNIGCLQYEFIFLFHLQLLSNQLQQPQQNIALNSQKMLTVDPCFLFLLRNLKIDLFPGLLNAFELSFSLETQQPQSLSSSLAFEINLTIEDLFKVKGNMNMTNGLKLEYNLKTLINIKIYFKKSMLHIFTTSIVQCLSNHQNYSSKKVQMNYKQAASTSSTGSSGSDGKYSNVVDLLFEGNNNLDSSILSTFYGSVHTFDPERDLGTTGDKQEIDNLVNDTFKRVFQQPNKQSSPQTPQTLPSLSSQMISIEPKQVENQGKTKKDTCEQDCFAIYELLLNDPICPSDFISSTLYFKAIGTQKLEDMSITKSCNLLFLFLYSLKTISSRSNNNYEIRIKGLEELRRLLLNVSTLHLTISLLNKFNYLKVLLSLLNDQSSNLEYQNEQTKRLYYLIVDVISIILTYHLYTIDFYIRNSSNINREILYLQVLSYVLKPLFNIFHLSTSFNIMLSNIYTNLNKYYLLSFSNHFIYFWYHFLQQFIFNTALPHEKVIQQDKDIHLFSSFDVEKLLGIKFFVKRGGVKKGKEDINSSFGVGLHRNFHNTRNKYVDIELIESLLAQKLDIDLDLETQQTAEPRGEMNKEWSICIINIRKKLKTVLKFMMKQTKQVFTSNLTKLDSSMDSTQLENEEKNENMKVEYDSNSQENQEDEFDFLSCFQNDVNLASCEHCQKLTETVIKVCSSGASSNFSGTGKDNESLISLFSCYAENISSSTLQHWYLKEDVVMANLLTFNKTKVTFDFFTKRMQDLCILCEHEGVIYSNAKYLAFPGTLITEPITLTIHNDHAQCLICLQHEDLVITKEGWLLCIKCQKKRIKTTFPKTEQEYEQKLEDSFYFKKQKECHLCGEHEENKDQFFELWTTNVHYHYSCTVKQLNNCFNCSSCSVLFTNNNEKYLLYKDKKSSIVCTYCYKTYLGSSMSNSAASSSSISCKVCFKSLNKQEQDLFKVQSINSPFPFNYQEKRKTINNDDEEEKLLNHYQEDIIIHKNCLKCCYKDCKIELSEEKFYSLLINKAYLKVYCKHHISQHHQIEIESDKEIEREPSFVEKLLITKFKELKDDINQIETKAFGRVYKVRKERKWDVLLKDTKWLTKFNSYTSKRNLRKKNKVKPSKSVKFQQRLKRRNSTDTEKGRYRELRNSSQSQGVRFQSNKLVFGQETATVDSDQDKKDISLSQRSRSFLSCSSQESNDSYEQSQSQNSRRSSLKLEDFRSSSASNLFVYKNKRGKIKKYSLAMKSKEKEKLKYLKNIPIYSLQQKKWIQSKDIMKDILDRIKSTTMTISHDNDLIRLKNMDSLTSL